MLEIDCCDIPEHLARLTVFPFIDQQGPNLEKVECFKMKTMCQVEWMTFQEKRQRKT
jgi:hypothetical protein